MNNRYHNNPFRQMLFAAGCLLIATTSQASTNDYITEAPAGGFDWTSATDYVVLYAPDAQVKAMGDKVKSNQNLDPEQKDNQFFYWVTDWDKKDLTLINVDRDGATNSYGNTDMLSITPQWAWGTGYFGKVGKAYDLSMIDDSYWIHLWLCDFGNATSKYTFKIGNTDEKQNHFDLEVGIPTGESNGDYVGVGSIGHDGKWYYVDIPVSDLVDENGNFGFTYDWSKPIANSFVFSFDKPTTSKTTKSGPEPGNTVYSYTITELGSAVSIDGVFFYKKASTAGIKTIGTDNGADARKGDNAYYTLQGQKVERPGKGVYIHHGKKVIL